VIQPTSSNSLITFTLLPEESQASYSIDEVFINQNNRLFTAVGITNEIEGQMQLNYTDPTASRFGLFTVNISTLTSDSSRRDNAIRSNWLESSKYPLATFQVTQVKNFPAAPQEGQNISFQLLGNLTIRQTTLPITWDVTAQLNGDRLTGTATTKIMLVDFGVTPPSIAGVLTVTDGATLTVNFTLQAQP
jgi:polyisoprenoid-binding protein YceI